MSIALYPGTFDPITNGHLNILERALPLFERVIITVGVNSKKKTTLDSDRRVALIETCAGRLSTASEKLEIVRFDGLLADYARERGATAIIRGLRTSADFEYEMQMALMNRRLQPGLETIFFPADTRYIHVNSSLIREVARLGGSVEGLVPEEVERELADSR